MPEDNPKSITEMVGEARERVENLTPEQAAAETDEALVVDVRESWERELGGAIPGAVHAPRGMLEFQADPESPYHTEGFDPNRRTILYCASGGRSALAADTLQQIGYTNVAHIDGGFTAWKEQGRPTEEAGS